MKKIGILGGTFNPIHNGHMAIAEIAYNSLCLDEIMFIPTGLSYLKSDINVLDKENRFMMTILATENVPYFTYSDIEINRTGNTYTKDTLIELREIYKDAWFYFIGGSDTLFNIEMWYDPQTIFDNCSLVILNRGEYSYEDLQHKKDELSEKFKAEIFIIDSPKIDISSTQIRMLINEGKFEQAHNMLPDAVFDYIISNNIYCEK